MPAENYMSHYITFKPNPLVDFLKDNWKAIKQEHINYITTNGNIEKPNNTDNQYGQILYTGKFNSMSLKLVDSLLDPSEKTAIKWKNTEKVRYYKDRLAEMPLMAEFVNKFDKVVPAITFNVCYPGAKLTHHFGLDEKYLRLHLTLQGAEGCVFDIESEKHQWTEGEVFGFDDALVYHGTTHTGTVPRVIVLIDVDKDYIKPFADFWPERTVRPPKEQWASLLK